MTGTESRAYAERPTPHDEPGPTVGRLNAMFESDRPTPLSAALREHDKTERAANLEAANRDRARREGRTRVRPASPLSVEIDTTPRLDADEYDDDGRVVASIALIALVLVIAVALVGAGWWLRGFAG